ncbi:MAG: hypothetical protein L0Z62_40330 [Gemmataceae bacterium]|nr:hypothetical protein [Gemmataceae bacterium]
MTQPTSRFPTLALTLALGACLLASLLRLFPLEWNFAPVGALALFAGARLRGWLAFALPLALMVVTDALLPLLRPDYSFLHAGMAFVYGSYVISVLMGRLLARTENPALITVGAVGNSLQFFVITNFGAWLALYPATLAGLVECYVAGLEFARGTLAGDLLFTAVLFGAYAWLAHLYFPAERVGVLAPADSHRE